MRGCRPSVRFRGKSPDSLKYLHLINCKAMCKRLVGWSEFKVPFRHKYGYIRDERLGVESYPYPVKENVRFNRMWCRRQQVQRGGESVVSPKLLCRDLLNYGLVRWLPSSDNDELMRHWPIVRSSLWYRCRLCTTRQLGISWTWNVVYELVDMIGDQWLLLYALVPNRGLVVGYLAWTRTFLFSMSFPRKVHAQWLLSFWTSRSFITFRVRRSRGEMYIGHARLCVCMSVCPTLLHGPRCNLGNGTGCPLGVHYWADLQSVLGFRCYDNIAPNAKCQRVLVLALCLVTLYCTQSVNGWTSG